MEGKKCDSNSCNRESWKDDPCCIFHSKDDEGKADDLKEAMAALLENHRRWLESNGERGERIDLYEPEISGYDFRGTILSRAILYGANLNYCTFSEADLSGVEMHGSSLCQADFCACNLREAQISGCDLHAAFFLDADLTNADISDSDLTDAEFNQAILRKANLIGVGCMETSFADADLSEANVSYAALWNSSLGGAILKDASLRGANLEGTRYVTAAQLLEVETLYDVKCLDLTRLPDWSQLSPGEQQHLTELVREKPDD